MLCSVCSVTTEEEKLALSFHGIFCQYQDLCNYEKLLGKVHPSVIRQLVYKMCFAEKNVEIGEVWLGLDLCIFSFSPLNVCLGFFVNAVSLVRL